MSPDQAFLTVLLKVLCSVQLRCRRSLVSLAGGLLLAVSMLLPTLAQAQTFLNFTGPATLSSGTALSQGAVYRYANVLPGIDALVTLAQFVGTTPQLTNLDDNATTTTTARFQPVITCAGTAAANANTTCYVRFDFAFVVAGTSTPTPIYGMVASAQDVDGNGVANGVREFVEFTGSSSVRLGATTTLVAGTPVAGGVRYNQTNPLDVQTGIGTGNQYEVYANYVSAITGLSIIGGNIIGTAGCLNTGAGCQRQNSYSFLPVDSNLPSMTVRKISNGGTGTFSFSGTNGWVTQSVSTITAGTARDSQSEALLDVNVATTITEAAPFGYSLQSITCTGLGAGTATPTVNGVNGGSVLISAAAAVSGNNIVCTFTNRKLAANLSITKNDGLTTVVAGNTVTYTITAVNNGPDSAAGAIIKDAPTAGLNCTTVTCASTAVGMCPAASFPFASLSTGIAISPSFPSGSTATLTVTCGVTATGQ
jgi:uncharacterized repeat protein (TIGR01451 family)